MQVKGISLGSLDSRKFACKKDQGPIVGRSKFFLVSCCKMRIPWPNWLKIAQNLVVPTRLRVTPQFHAKVCYSQGNFLRYRREGFATRGSVAVR